MMYVTGGWAWGKVQDSFDMSVTGDRVPLLAVGGFGMECGGLVTHHCFATSSSKTLNGWTLGGGTEIALTEHVTFKAEYLS